MVHKNQISETLSVDSTVICTYALGVKHACLRSHLVFDPCARDWPLHDIAIANIEWCMAYTRGVGRGSYIAQSPCDSIATVWAMQAGRKNARTIDSCTND